MQVFWSTQRGSGPELGKCHEVDFPMELQLSTLTSLNLIVILLTTKELDIEVNTNLISIKRILKII